MSYGITPYRVSLSRLSTIFGKASASERSQARDACASIAEEMDDMFDDGGPAFMDIVDELLDGKASHEDYGAMYWYAIEQIVDHLGAALDGDDWYPASAEPFWEHPAARLYNIDAPMEIPSPDDFPSVFVIRRTDMGDALVAEFMEDIDDEAEFEAFAGWVKEAMQHEQDLVLYYY